MLGREDLFWLGTLSLSFFIHRTNKPRYITHLDHFLAPVGTTSKSRTPLLLKDLALAAPPRSSQPAMVSEMQFQSTMDALVKLRDSTSTTPAANAVTASPARSDAAPPGGPTASTTAPSAPGSAAAPFVWTKLADKTLSFFASQVDIGEADFPHIVETIREKNGEAPTVNEVRARVAVMRQQVSQKKQIV